MKVFGDNSPDLDLKCDFPAREAFREALLARLLTLNASHPIAQSEESATSRICEPDFRELSDDELDLLSAAGSDTLGPDNWAGTPYR